MDTVDLPETAPNIPREKPDDLSDEASLKRRLQGVLLFRLLLGIFFLVLILVVQSHRGEDLAPGQPGSLYLFSVILFLFTIIAAWSLERVRNLRRFAYLQVLFDVEAVTFLIYLSGGVESIFSFLYMPAIVAGAVLLYRRGSLVSATACALSYGLLLDLQFFGWIAPLQIMGRTSLSPDSGAYFQSILMNIAGFYLTAYLAGYLAEAWMRSSLQVRAHKRDIHQLEMLHRNIIQSLSSGLVMINPNGEVLFTNDAAQKILGLSSDQIAGRTIQNIFSTLDHRGWSHRGPESYRDKPEILTRKELTYQRSSGETLSLGYSVSLLHRENGGTWGWVLIFQDLTPLRAMEEHLQRAERMAQAGKMASEIAHEIRNPLAAISGAAQMLQHEMAREPFHARLMSIISREVRRIDDLISDFLWMAKGPQKSENVAEVSVSTAIDEVVSQLKAKDILNENHKVEKVLEILPTFLMEPLRLRQVLWQIMANGLQAMPDGGILTVRVAESQAEAPEQGETIIEISDTGIGLAEDNRARMFEPFFTSKNSGTGLGLSIVYQLMESLGGRIEANSDGQSGTSVTLFFPSSSAFPLAK